MSHGFLTLRVMCPLIESAELRVGERGWDWVMSQPQNSCEQGHGASGLWLWRKKANERLSDSMSCSAQKQLRCSGVRSRSERSSWGRIR